MFQFDQEGHRGVVVITTAQLHSTKPEFRFCTGSNPARSVSEICDYEISTPARSKAKCLLSVNHPAKSIQFDQRWVY